MRFVRSPSVRAGASGQHRGECPLVEAGAKALAGAREHDGAQARRSTQAFAGGDDRLEHRGIERVELVGAIERDLGDAIGDLDTDPLARPGRGSFLHGLAPVSGLDLNSGWFSPLSGRVTQRGTRLERIVQTADVQEHREHSGGRCDEKPVVARTAKGEIGDHFGRANLSDQFAARRVTLNPVSSANPNIALDIHPQTVRDPRRYFGKNSTVE